MSDVFISYAREDKAKAQELARIFSERGLTVWWDKIIPPGKKYSQVIAEELAAAGSVIVLWSRASVESDWVKDEAQEGAGRGVLIPVLIEDVKIPFGFRQLQAVNLVDWVGSDSHPEVARLISEVGGRARTPPATDVRTAAEETVRTSTGTGDGGSSGRGRTAFFGLGAAALVLLLGYVGYRLFAGRGDAVVVRPDPAAADNRPAAAAPSPTPGGQSTDEQARLRAISLTADGIERASNGNNDGAILLYNEAIRIRSDFPDAYFYRGQSHAILRRNNRAVADFRRVLALQVDDDMRESAQNFIKDIQTPPPPPRATPGPGPANVPVVGTNAATADARPQINQIFAEDKSARIAATTKLIIERKRDPQAVALAVRAAQEQPKNKAGVINTLVLLQSVDPAILKKQRAEIEKLLEMVVDNGPQTVEHVKKVRDILNS